MSRNDRLPPLLDELLKKWNNKHPYGIGWVMDREAFVVGGAMEVFLARPDEAEPLTLRERAHHAALVLLGKAEAYQFWEDRRR